MHAVPFHVHCIRLMEMLSHCTRQLSRCTVAAIPADQRSDTIDIVEAGFKMDASPMRDAGSVVLIIADGEHFQLTGQSGKIGR